VPGVNIAALRRMRQLWLRKRTSLAQTGGGE
jgi:hypothetical protein